MSAGPLSDTVMTLNLPMVGAADAAKDDFLMQWAMTDVFATMEVIILFYFNNLNK